MWSDKPQIKLYAYISGAFVLQAIIDDYQSCSFERTMYSAGQFTIEINYNIPNAQLFERGLWVQFGTDTYDFGEILSITDVIGEDGKQSQMRTITGYDARYIFKRRIIKNLNADTAWSMTDSGELCMRNLIADQCGVNAETKRQLPVINEIPETGLGGEYSVSEAYSNLYDTLCTIAEQSALGWRIAFDVDADTQLTLECYTGDYKANTVFFSTDFDSLESGEFTDSAESYCNAIYIGGKGDGEERDIYEGETFLNSDKLMINDSDFLLLDDYEGKLIISGYKPDGINRFEAWDDQSAMTEEEEYKAEAWSMLQQYGQTITVSGAGLAKNPYQYKSEYNVGDTISVSFSGKKAAVQVLSVTEHWEHGNYDIEFTFGKPENDISKQLSLLLNKIQTGAISSSSTDSVKWYTTPTDTAQKKSEVTYDVIGFLGTGGDFKLYFSTDGTGAKTYHVYVKQTTGDITLNTGVSGAETLTLEAGTYVTIIYVDDSGNIIQVI